MSTPAVIASKICDKCTNSRPLTNFMSRGYHTTSDGTRICYRATTCRKCVRELKKLSGICLMCTQQVKPGSHHCEKHLQLMRDCMKRRKLKDKTAAFNRYGTNCAYCHDDRQLFLTIDHINNDGAEHRRQQRSGNNQGHDIYAWLRKHHYPEGFQTLCYNCNCVKSQIGEIALLTYLELCHRHPLPTGP